MPKEFLKLRVTVDKLKRIAKLGEFIPHGDDSIIDDAGIANRWAERRRARIRQRDQTDELNLRGHQEEAERRMQENLQRDLQQVRERETVGRRTAHQCDVVMEQIRNQYEE